METYVWELTHALQAQGMHVEVICEQVYGSPSPLIKIHLVKAETKPSRWKAMLAFKVKVNRLLNSHFLNRKIIVHSHERSLSHHVTTFHGPPMEPKLGWWYFSQLSPRIKAWKTMEQEELLSPCVQIILPVSQRIQDKIISLHPDAKNKRMAIAYPGVHPTGGKQKSEVDQPKNIDRFIFVGKEWKRKGLIFAIKLIESYESRFNKCTLDVYGPATSDIAHIMKNRPNISIKGWSPQIPWGKYDALIHPATNEPFGMVVPEARSHGIPVLTTNLVGSAELEFNGVELVEISAGPHKCSENLFELTKNKSNRNREIKWTWQNLASQHLNEIYPLIEL